MNCHEYSVLLEKLLDGSASVAEQAELCEHESACPDCAAQRRALDGLQEEMISLKDDVPPLPEDFHQAWMKRVEVDTMESRKPRTRFNWNRMLSTAAALVFVIGGTLLTKDQLNPPEESMKQYGALQSRYALEESYDAVGGGVMLASASYNDAADMDVGVSMKHSVMNSAAAPAAEPAREQKLIRTAGLTIGTQTFDESLAALRRLCEDNGGWIAHSSEDVLYNGKRQAYLSLRIPAPQLDSCLSSTEGLGRITNRYESTTDVSESYYDTQARLETQQALMARLQSLVTDAASLSDLLALEKQIADTQYEIDRLQSNLNSTDRQVDYATVDVTLQEETPADTITDTKKTLWERLAGALETGLTAFLDFMQDALVFLTAALPFLMVVAVLWIIRRIVRRRKKK